MIKLEFWGKEKFFRLTETIRNRFKSDVEEFTVKEFPLDERLPNGKPNEGQIMIHASKPNDAELQEGIIKLVDQKPDFVQKFEPVQIRPDAYMGGVTLSVHRPTLERDIWKLVSEYKRTLVQIEEPFEFENPEFS